MTAAHFQLHPQLQKDCHVLGVKDKVQLLLHKNRSVTWFILVPETEALELYSLPPEQRQALNALADHLSRSLIERGADKVNVAAIGNMVPQLHYHVVGRTKDDPAWPGVVWGRLPETSCRTELELRELSVHWDQLSLT